MALDEGMGTKKALALAGGVVVLVCAAIALFDGESEDSSADEPIVVEEEVLEVHPLVPTGAIRTASWHDDSGEAPVEDLMREPAQAGSLIDELGKDPERDARAEKSLEEVVRRVNGLGVYVAPEEKDDAPGSKKK